MPDSFLHLADSHLVPILKSLCLSISSSHHRQASHLLMLFLAQLLLKELFLKLGRKLLQQLPVQLRILQLWPGVSICLTYR